MDSDEEIYGISKMNEITRLSGRAECDMPCFLRITKHMDRLRRVYGSLKNVEGQSILDLGCGSKLEGDGRTKIGFEPWFCWTAHVLGANIVGVDICRNTGEVFTNYQRDLTKKDALDMLPRASFHLVHNSFFLPPNEADVIRTCPTLMKMTSASQLSAIRIALMTTVTDLLTDNGVYFSQETIFRKGNEALVVAA